MNIDQFLELAKGRRSIRKFKPDPVPDEMVDKILEAARWAPSGINVQPWEFIVVRSQETRYALCEIIDRFWQVAYDVEQTRVPEVKHTKFLVKDHHPVESWRDAPLFIVVCADPRVGQGFMLVDSFLPLDGGHHALFFKSIANATLMLMLAAAASGLGAAWISLPCLEEPDIKKVLNVPKEISVQTIVPIGYPAHEPKPSWRREADQIIHQEKYDPAKYRSGSDIFNYLVQLRKRTGTIWPDKKA